MLEEAEQQQSRADQDERYTMQAWDIRTKGLRSSQQFPEEHIYRTNPVYMAHEYEYIFDENSDINPYVADYM